MNIRKILGPLLMRLCILISQHIAIHKCTHTYTLMHRHTGEYEGGGLEFCVLAAVDSNSH